MAPIRHCVLALSALAALTVGLSCDVANAAKPGGGGSAGDCFSLSPSGSFTNRDLSSEIGFYISTADAMVRNGILVRTSTTTHPAYSNGSYWISFLSYLRKCPGFSLKTFS